MKPTSPLPAALLLALLPLTSLFYSFALAAPTPASAPLIPRAADVTTTNPDSGPGSSSDSDSLDADASASLGPPPPMWTIRCPREVQGLCTPDDRLFYCTPQGSLYNALSATCSACTCRTASGNSRPPRRRVL